MKTYEEMAENVLRRRDRCVARTEKRNRLLLRGSCMAFGMCLAIVGAVFVWRGTRSNRHEWPTRQVVKQGSEIARIPYWEDMTLSQRFPEVRYGGAVYSSQCTNMDAAMIGDRLAEATLTGNDIYTDTEYQADADVYAIKGISAACATALRFAGDGEYYVYVNSSYRPDTLGQLLDDLNLLEHMSFGSAWYSYQKKPGTAPVQVEFVDPAEEQIWELLFSDLSAENSVDAGIPSGKVCVMTVSTDIPLLGYRNISVGVTEDGYLITNILATEKCFFIGEEATGKFVSYVTGNCRGYEIQYVDPADPVEE